MQRFSSILRPIRLLLLPAFGLLMPACEEAVRDVLKAKRTKELREIYQVGIDAIDANYPYGVEVQPPMSGCDSLEYPGPPTRVIYDTMLGGDWGGVNISPDSMLSVAISVYDYGDERMALAQYRVKVHYDTMTEQDRVYPIFWKKRFGQWEVVGYQ